jgi:hypothetical protein
MVPAVEMKVTVNFLACRVDLNFHHHHQFTPLQVIALGRLMFSLTHTPRS